MLKHPIKDTKEDIIKIIQSLATAGITALGPGVLSSIAMASKGAPGSQVIVCTDGMANKGIGAMSGWG